MRARLALPLLLAGTGSGTALAAEPALRPVLDARLRYEAVDQDGLPRDAAALTARVRAGAEAAVGDWSVLAEAEGTLALVGNYNSGVNGRTAFPVVADPETIELNRLQLQYRGLPNAVVTLGRQRINLDDQRFVGAVGWRDNEQTFDAARLEWTIAPGLRTDLTYSWSVRTIWGSDGVGARPQAIAGDNVFATLGWTMPLGTLTGFAYFVDQDEAAISGFGLSNRTFGVRLTGSRPIGAGFELGYALSYARQRDHHRNPSHYAADYGLIDASLRRGGLRIGGGYEVLGASDGRPLTSFQTPLATLHRFQGWADKFLVTPPDGIRDLYGSAGYNWQNALGFSAIGVQAVYHRYRSDRLGIDYGDEIDLLATARRGRFGFTLKYADYRAERFGADTRKFWGSVEWTF